MKSLYNNMEHFLTDPATFRIGYSADPGADFRKQCEAYAQTNALPFTNVARLVQGKIVLEFDSFRSGPHQINNFTSCQLDRCAAAIKLLRNFYDPVVFPFIYNMSIKKGQFQYIFIDMCNEILARRQPVSEMRRALNDPLLGKFIDLPALWEEVRQRMASAIDTPNHVCTQTGERLDELMPFIIDYLPKIDDEWKLLVLEDRLRPFWPEYRISLQRNMIWGKIENLESSVDLTGGKKKMEEDFKNAPCGGFRLDLRKKYNTLPPPATERMPEKK